LGSFLGFQANIIVFGEGSSELFQVSFFKERNLNLKSFPDAHYQIKYDNNGNR